MSAEQVREDFNGAFEFEPEWPEPQPLPGGLPHVPRFDDCLLPNGLRRWIVDIAERAQAPLDFPAAGAIVALSSALGRRLSIRPKRYDDWLVVPNLWGMIIGPPAFLKSPMLHEIMKPLSRLEEAARREYKRNLEEHQLRTEALQAERKRLISKSSRPKCTSTHEELLSQLRELSAEAPIRKRYIVNDPTVEKLGEILNQNPAGVLLYRDEIAGFLGTMERAGHENDRAFYMEAWNGYSRYTYDRVGRGTLDIEAACVSILGAITPGPLGAYLRETFSGIQDDGLIQRFQLSVYPDAPPAWRNVDRAPDTDAQNEIFELFRRFVSFVGDVPAGEILSIRFDDEAQEFFDGWRRDLEARIRNPDEHPVMIAHLGKYRSLMPSLALIFHLCDSALANPVTLEAAKRAAAWCGYLEPHGRRIYHSITSRTDAFGRLIGEKILSRKLPSPFTARDVYRHQWTGLSEAEDLTRALEVLVELGWLASETSKPSSIGGRPTVQYHINPKVWPQA